MSERPQWYKLQDDAPVPVPPDEWSAWFETHTKDRIVRQETIDDVSISTVFLGIDHSFGIGDEPLIFETMIFGGEHDNYQERYATREQALAGHERAVALVLGVKS